MNDIRLLGLCAHEPIANPLFPFLCARDKSSFVVYCIQT